VVRHFGVWRIDAMKACLSQAQAKIDVTKSKRQAFVHAIDGKVRRLLNHQARCCHCAASVVKNRPAKVPFFGSRNAIIRKASNAT